jgi:hypothetical protein
MKPRNLISGLLILCFFAALNSAQLVPDQYSTSLNLLAGDVRTQTIYINNTGNTTQDDILSALGGGTIPSSWITLPPLILSIQPSQKVSASFTIVIPGSTTSGNYSSYIFFQSDSGQNFRHNVSLSIIGTTTTTVTSSSTTTTLTEDNWDTIISGKYMNEGDVATWQDSNDNDYALEMYYVEGSTLKARLTRNDNQISRNTLHEGDKQYMGSHYQLELIRLKATDDTYQAKVNLYADDYYKVTMNGTTSTDYPYILINNQRFPLNTALDFGTFLMKITYIGWNGVYITISGSQTSNYLNTYSYQQPSNIACLTNQDCEIVSGTILNVISTDTQTATIKVKSKNNMLVRMYTGTDTSSYSMTQNNPFSKLTITLCGGKVKPGAKAIFCVLDPTTSTPVTGTFALNQENAKTADIRQGYAEIFIPKDLICPVTVTAIVDGQPTMQMINSCDDTGSTAPEITGMYNTTSTISNPTMTITLSNTQPFINTVLTVTIRSSGTPLEQVNLDIKKPDGTTDTQKTDSDGSITYTPDKAGDYQITASKAGFNDQKGTFKARLHNLGIQIVPDKLKYTIGDTISLGISDADTNTPITGATIMVNGQRIFSSGFQLADKGTYTITADYTNYQTATRNLNVLDVTAVTSTVNLKVGENSTILLNNPTDWKIMKDGQVIQYGTGSSITFTPPEGGQYSIVADSRTIGTYEASGFNWTIMIGLLVVIAVVLIIVIAKKGSADKNLIASRQGSTKSQKDMAAIMEKIREGKVEVGSFQ